MTTIATDGWSLAGDGRSTNGDAVSDTDRRKVFPLEDGSIIGISGRTRDGERAARALLANPSDHGDAKGDYTLLRLHRNGRVEVYEGSLSDPIKARPPYAIGSGWVPAVAAMRAGAEPKAAVKIAASLDVFTGGKITSYSR